MGSFQNLPTFVEVRKLQPEAQLPVRAHEDDAGLDIYSAEEFTLQPGEGRTVQTGIAMAIPVGHVGLVYDRSSMARKGVKSAGGVIDAGYRGEVHIVLWNISKEPVSVAQGDRIAQLLIFPVATPRVKEVALLEDTARGQKGFGSSGR